MTLNFKNFSSALTAGAKIRVVSLDPESATNGQVVKYNSGTGNVEWGDETVSAGEIALAEGNVLVGNASGVSVALNAKGDAKLLLGNGTTITSVSMSGDATITNAGALTIANSAVTNVKVSASAAIDYSKLAALTSGNILVGSAGNVATSVAMSGDATIANTGAVTVTASTGAFAVGTTFKTANTTTSTGAGAVAITGMIHEITTTGTGNALTLADGAEGQHLVIVYVAEGAGGDTAVLTPTNLAGASTTITFNALGDSAHLIFTAGGWYFLGGAAAVA